MRHLRRTSVLVAAALLATARLAHGASLAVEMTGTDSATCGKTSPCRTISQAVTNAAAGDTINVGPGFYAEEVLITKSVNIYSRLGSSSTVVRPVGGAPGFYIQAGNVAVGKLNKGFTITTTGNPFLISGSGTLVGVQVIGNVMLLEDPMGPSAIVSANTAGGRIEHNRVFSQLGCSYGFFLIDSADLVEHNTIIGCTHGFYVQSGDNIRLVGNAAIGNDYTDSNGVGFDLSGTIAEFTGNVAVGNGTGVNLPGPIAKFQNNAFYGSRTHCGTRSFSAATIDASKNYWGSASGPGAGTADSACDSGGGTTITTPFLTRDPSKAQTALK